MTQVSIIIPTYNESQNIKKILKSIGEYIPKNISTEAIVVDDNSPDGTGKIVEEYLKTVKELADYTISIIHRKAKQGLSAAILHGIQQARGETIVVMDSDFSHPPSLIPKMIEALKVQYDLVVASRYTKGGKIQGWPIQRKIISKIATSIAKNGLNIDTKDPMSGFFAFKRHIINELKFDTRGYKMLLEILVKCRDVKIHELPYTFKDRELGNSKLGTTTVINYIRDVLKLYRDGNAKKHKTSVRFASKAARFFTVGASGVLVNFIVSLFFTEITQLWYIHSSIIGILVSITSNFILNKHWTFNDVTYSKDTIPQYTKFVMSSSLGALVQITLIYYLIDMASYPLVLITAVGIAAFGNFIINKRWTFKEKIWS